MNLQNVLETEWPWLLSLLATEEDLEASARNAGVLQRRREIKSASDLLRMALVYGFCGLSLRQTAAWAEAVGVGILSDVAVLWRLRRLAPWLKGLLDAKLHQRTTMTALGAFGMRLRLLDATCISRPGSHGADWRLHLGFDANSLSLDHMELTDGQGGETLERFPIDPNDLVVVDAGYAHRSGVWAVRQSGGHVVVRLTWQNFPLLHPDGSPLDMIEVLRQTPSAGTADHPVLVTGDKERLGQTFPARLIVMRKSPEATARAQQRILKERRRKQRLPDPRTMEAAAYVFVLTSVGAERLPADRVLEVYRFRWQIELAFKRLKSLLHLGELPAKDPHLAQTLLCAKLLGALLLDELVERSQAFSPWGVTSYRDILVARPAGSDQGDDDCRDRRRNPLLLAHS